MNKPCSVERARQRAAINKIAENGAIREGTVEVTTQAITISG